MDKTRADHDAARSQAQQPSSPTTEWMKYTSGALLVLDVILVTFGISFYAYHHGIAILIEILFCMGPVICLVLLAKIGLRARGARWRAWSMPLGMLGMLLWFSLATWLMLVS